MSKIRRKVTVENSKTISDSSSSNNNTTTSSRRPSVFERLGPSTASNAAETHCRNWLKTGNCSYGNTCRYTHGTSLRGKGFSGMFNRSVERPTGDLRERMKNKRQDVDGDTLKKDTEESTSPTTRKDSSRSRHRKKEDIKITKEHTPASEEETADWEGSREDSDNGDYDYELSLEMKRQKIQRELMKLEQENLDKRDEMIIRKEEPLSKTRISNTLKDKASPECTSSKGSPLSRKSSGSNNSNKKDKKSSTTSVIPSPVSDQTRTEETDNRLVKTGHGKRKGPRTPSPLLPVHVENLVIGKKHKNKHKNKEKSEDKPKEVKEKGHDMEKHKEKKEKRRDRSDSSNKAKCSVTSEEQTGSVSSPSREALSAARRKSSSPKSTSQKQTSQQRSRTPPHHRRSPSTHSRRQHSPSSHSSSSAQRHSPSPHHRRGSVSPTYQRDLPPPSSSSPPIQSLCHSRSPLTPHRDNSSSPTPRRSSPNFHHRSQARERGRGEKDRSPVQQERRHEHRDENYGKRDKDSCRDERDQISRDDHDGRDSRDRRGERDRRNARDERQHRGEVRDTRDVRATEMRDRSGRESLEHREREHDRDKKREIERNESYRKEETAAQEERNHGRGHGKDELRNESRADNRNESRNERTGRGRGRGPELQDQKGSSRGNRVSQGGTSSTGGHDSWDSRSSFRERSNERNIDRDRYDNDRQRGEKAREDRRVGHAERDHRDNRERDQRVPSPGRQQNRVEDHEREERREDRRSDRGEERRDDRIRDREREREREREKEREKERVREREKEREREAERERERNREREREREKEREREREREEREREREERGREREREKKEREREQRERERQREWEEREKGREDRRERRDELRDDRTSRGAHEERKNIRKRHRAQNTPSPRPSPKRGRDVSPADSEGYNSTEEKGDKHRLLSQVVRPQETPCSPVCLFTDDKNTRWKDEDRRADKQDGHGRHEEVDSRNERTAGRGAERRGDHAEVSANMSICDSGRAKELRDLPAAALTSPSMQERDSAVFKEGKKRTKSQKKNVKKNHKEEEGEAGVGERSKLEPPNPSIMAEAHQPLLSPCKTPKKKTSDRKRKCSDGADSDFSENELVTQHPISKKRRGPHTPPPINKDDLPYQRALTAGPSNLAAKIDANFSDWSDEDVPERGETSSALSSEKPPERMLSSERPPRRGAHCGGRERTDPPIAPLLPDAPVLIQSLPLQPLLPQHMLRKTQQADIQQRSGSMGSNHSRASSRRLRSPSKESVYRDESQQGLRSRRGYMQGTNTRDWDRERERERDQEREREREKERERAVASEQIGGERKSRIDHLRRGEPSRSTSSDRQDSRSHSSRRSSPESEHQTRSRDGSYDSRDRDRERDQLEREREKNRLQNQQTLQRDWEPEHREWSGRGKEPLLRCSREPNREREMWERERILPDGLLSHDRQDRDRGERDRERERNLPFDLQTHREPKIRAEMKMERGEFEPAFTKEAFMDVDKPGDASNFQGEVSEPEKTDGLDEEDRKGIDGHSVSGGEEYEPISDDELDEILAGSQKRDEQQDEKISGPVDVIDVDWSSLIPRQKQEPRAPGAALLRFTPGAVLLRTGVSRHLAGHQLLAKVKEVCFGELEDPKDADQLLEHDLGALNMAAYNRKMEKTNLLRSLGPCCKALCARRDIAIRRQLLKNDKGTTKQIYTSAPVVDNELLQLSLRLFKKKMYSSQCSAQKSDSAPSAQQLSTPEEVSVS